MSSSPDKFFLTTPIYYVNARPHIGHAYTTIVADVLARRARAQGIETFFLTGTDEHGQKIERSAQAAGIPPQQFTDQVSAEFEKLWKRMGITNDKFIRTTDPAHKRGVQKLFRTLQQNGHIYLDSYTGAYCVSDESFIDVPAGAPCPDCGRITEIVTEENYFFRLSAFGQQIIDLIESSDPKKKLTIEPDSRRNEVLSFLRGGLKDLSISRSSFTWGIPVPTPTTVIPGEARDLRISPSLGAPQAPKQDHVIYVWLDALANYMTALGYGSDDESLWQKFWPADLHIVGKEIIRFHCVYWPAFLLAAGIKTPKKVVAHGWLLFEESKMSKSKGNIVRTETILDAFGTLCPPPAPLLSSRSEAEGSASAVSDAKTVPQWLKPDDRPAGYGTAEAVPLSRTDDSATNSSAVSDSAANDLNPATTQPDATEAASLEGTGSPVPLQPHTDPAASAAEVHSPSPHDRDLFASDVLRYFLLREIPFGQDGSFSFDALITRYNADLANGYGNLVSRTLNMIHKYCDGSIPTSLKIGRSGYLSTETMDGRAHYAVEGFANCFEKNDFSEATLHVFSFFISYVDAFITSAAPWKVAAAYGTQEQLADILYPAAEAIRIITALLYPILPYATANVWRQLGLGDIGQAAANGDLTNLQWGGLKPGTKLGPLSPIFPRADKGLAATMSEMENEKNLLKQAEQTATPPDATESPVASEKSAESVKSAVGLSSFDPAAPPRTSAFAEPNPGAQVAASSAHTTERPGTPSHTEADASGIFRAPPATPPGPENQITIDDFAKVELRVAKILVCERIPKADKLLRLEVDLGDEKRQILSGIAEWYTPEELIGRRIVVITNLAPRKMRGLESHGMLLAASTEGGKPALATFLDLDELPLGARLK